MLRVKGTKRKEQTLKRVLKYVNRNMLMNYTVVLKFDLICAELVY